MLGGSAVGSDGLDGAVHPALGGGLVAARKLGLGRGLEASEDSRPGPGDFDRLDDLVDRVEQEAKAVDLGDNPPGDGGGVHRLDLVGGKTQPGLDPVGGEDQALHVVGPADRDEEFFPSVQQVVQPFGRLFKRVEGRPGRAARCERLNQAGDLVEASLVELRPGGLDVRGGEGHVAVG